MKRYLLLLAAFSLVLSAVNGMSAEPSETAAPTLPETAVPAQGGTVLETMDSGGYTYVLIDADGGQIWAVAPEFAVKTGDAVMIPDGMVMKDYTSKTLNRTFEKLRFVGEVMVNGSSTLSPLPAGHPSTDNAGETPPKQAAVAPGIDFSGLGKAAQTVEEIFAGKDALAGKEVSVRGKVVKFSPQIMKTNWLHLQDGTGSEGTSDLVVTTEAVVAQGDTVLVTGILAADKDFGFGYHYDAIVEGAEVIVE